MASISLPRVLQLKKNSLDAEREQFEKFQTLAIQKAINSIETPVKEKHVRSTIIGSFQEQSAITYWMVAVRLPLQDNRIVAWKFCHVTHKLLREGHPACLDDSQRHIGMIENLGKLWVHLREGYGKLVHLYCNLLVCKLKFHARNPRFPGNMQLTADELDNIAENDVNNYFQLCVELFDYMDDILNLQAAVFDSLGNARANSMTASGQCRLAALIPCAQDSSQIYDCNVRLLFRLHAALPPDTLTGHRERFRQQFKKLSSFYKHASSLQYYRNLLTLPVLPSNPPNFLQQSDFGTYVTPVVSIPEPPPDDVDSVAALIDTSDTMSQMTDHFEELDVRPTPSPQPDPIVERDRLIDHLQNELKRMRGEVSQMVQERNTMMSSMKEHCTRIEQQLQASQNELEEEKSKAEILAVQTPEIKQKLTETEEKARTTDEKFQKLKGAYTQLREEHIALIRQKAEVDKQTASLRAAAAQHESAKTQLQQQLNDRMKDVELLQQSASSSEEIEAYKSEITNVRAELEQSRQKEIELETVRASLESLRIEHDTAKTELEDKINTVTNELKETVENLQNVIREKEESQTELVKVKEELVGLREKSGDEFKKVCKEKDLAVKQVQELKEQFQKEKEELTTQSNDTFDKLRVEIETLLEKNIEIESNYDMECQRLNDELSRKHDEFNDLLSKKESELAETLNSLKTTERELDACKSDFENKITEKYNEINIKQELFDKLTEEYNEIKLQLESSNEEVENLKNELQITLDKNNNEINELQRTLREKSEFGDQKRCETESLTQKISELDNFIVEKDEQIAEQNAKLEEITSELVKVKSEFESQRKESSYELTLIQTKFDTVTESKDDIISSLKSMIAEKDSQVISMNVENSKLTEEVARLSDLLNETQAELEIANNELLALNQEHNEIVNRNEDNLALKNKELRSLYDEIKALKDNLIELQKEKEGLTNDYTIEKQGLESNINELNDNYNKLNEEYNTYKTEQENIVIDLNEQINKMKMELKTTVTSKNKEIAHLKESCENVQADYNNDIENKNIIITEGETNINKLKLDVEELKKCNENDKQEMAKILAEKEKLEELMNARLEHIEGERLTAECELQDLLQHNSVLEADVAALRRQLEEADANVEEKSKKLLSCASEMALQMMSQALSALDKDNAQETNKVGAELAAQALEQLAKCTEVTGNEEMLAKSALNVAHNTAQLSAYVTEVSHITTDSEISEKLTNECRAMLVSAKECISTVGAGDSLSCSTARGRVLCMLQAAAGADTVSSAGRAVDDELADMDRAIEQAASQIEEMLIASRAADPALKLEVNEDILDACTSLMAAVKVLVQDARKLQNELGDTKTRQKMYRKNPQWSEGLISAAKAVVFAAKLLVSAADEAMSGSAGAAGVAAGAQEVAGATAQLVAASRARAPPAAPALARLAAASRAVPPAAGAVLAAVRARDRASRETEALDTSALTLTATRRLEMESKVRSLELESALDAERTRLAALRKHHYHLAQLEENGNVTNGK